MTFPYHTSTTAFAAARSACARIPWMEPWGRGTVGLGSARALARRRQR